MTERIDLSFTFEPEQKPKTSREKFMEKGRTALLEIGKVVPGEVLLIPPQRVLADAMGFNIQTLYHHVSGGQVELGKTLTGLSVVQHAGLVVFNPGNEPISIAEALARSEEAPEA
jgi:hypothetical protein